MLRNFNLGQPFRLAVIPPNQCSKPQHFLNFFPLPHGHGAFLSTLLLLAWCADSTNFAVSLAFLIREPLSPTAILPIQSTIMFSIFSTTSNDSAITFLFVLLSFSSKSRYSLSNKSVLARDSKASFISPAKSYSMVAPRSSPLINCSVDELIAWIYSLSPELLR